MILYGELRFKPLWGRLTIKLSHLLLCLSSALNIIIYSYKVLSGKRVRPLVFILGLPVPSGPGQQVLSLEMFNKQRYVTFSPGAGVFFLLSALGSQLTSFSLSRLETRGE